MNLFLERYRTLSNAQLLKILDSPGDYQIEAVEAAQITIGNRQLTDAELTDAITFNDSVQEKDRAVEGKKIAIGNKMKDIGNFVADTLNPIQNEKQNTNKIIVRVSILMGILSLFQFFSQFELIKYMLANNSEGKKDFNLLVYLLPLIIAPLGTILFWMRKNWGWVLIAIFLSYSSLLTMVIFLMSYKFNNTVYNLFPPKSVLTYLLQLFFFAGCLWVICSKEIMEIYIVRKKNRCYRYRNRHRSCHIGNLVLKRWDILPPIPILLIPD